MDKYTSIYILLYLIQFCIGILYNILIFIILVRTISELKFINSVDISALLHVHMILCVSKLISW